MPETNTSSGPGTTSSGQSAAAPPVDPTKLLMFQVPEVTGVTAYFVKDKAGKIIARTEDELNAA